LIQDPIFSEITDFLCQYFTEHHWKPYCEHDQSGLLRHIYLRIGKATGDVMLCLVLSRDQITDQEHFVSVVTRRFPQIKSIVFNINNQNTNVILGDAHRTVFGDDSISDVLLDTKLNLSHRSFYQVNHDATELLYQTAFDLAKIGEHDLVLDLFCGIGSIALTSKASCPIIGVEIVPEAIENAKENARINHLQNTHFVCGDANAAFDLITDFGSKNPLLILDPPRKGIASELIRDIAKHNIKKVLYISCGPDTLARDLSLFRKEGYSISPIQPVDLFPRTGHIECICLLER
jgi:23S rRNA (uracil1939-C5)-methyltransferase